MSAPDRPLPRIIVLVDDDAIVFDAENITLDTCWGRLPELSATPVTLLRLINDPTPEELLPLLDLEQSLKE